MTLQVTLLSCVRYFHNHVFIIKNSSSASLSLVSLVPLLLDPVHIFLVGHYRPVGAKGLRKVSWGTSQTHNDRYFWLPWTRGHRNLFCVCQDHFPMPFLRMVSRKFSVAFLNKNNHDLDLGAAPWINSHSAKLALQCSLLMARMQLNGYLLNSISLFIIIL